MRNTFSQSGNDSKWLLKNIIFQNRYMALETPPPFMAKTILNFHFDYLIPSLMQSKCHYLVGKCNNPMERMEAELDKSRQA